jgi:hypothetical protein
MHASLPSFGAAGRRAFTFLLGLFGTLSVATLARAEQFVLFDAEFTYTWQDASTSSPSLSHFYVNEGNFLDTERPDNWSSPVNYRDGTVHIRLEVIDKPAGDQQAGWALCYVGNAGSYGCPYTDYYESAGVYGKDVDMHSFYNNATIDWSQGIRQVDLIYTVNNSGSGHITNFPELQNLTTPTTLRITMIQVSEGDSYDASILGEQEPEPSADAGAPLGGAGGVASGGSGSGGAPAMAGSTGFAAGGTGGSGGMAGAGAMPAATGGMVAAGGAAPIAAPMSGATGGSGAEAGGCHLGFGRGAGDFVRFGGLFAALGIACRRRSRRLG